MERQTNAAAALSARHGTHFADPASVSLSLPDLQALKKAREQRKPATLLAPLSPWAVRSDLVVAATSPQNITATKSEMQQSKNAGSKQNESNLQLVRRPPAA